MPTFVSRSGRHVELFSSNLSLLTRLGRSGEGEPLVASGSIADSRERERADNESGLFCFPARGISTGLPGLVLSTLPVAAGGFEGFAGSGIVAGFGGELSTKAEHMRPATESTVGGFPLLGMSIVGSLAQCPAGLDEPSGVG